MKKCLFVMLGSGLLVCGGCASMVKKVDVNKGLDSYYSQQRTVDLVTIKGSNMTISATGVNEMKVSSILPPLNAIPREPGVLEKAIGGVADVAKFGLGFYYGNQMLGKALEQPRTVSPEIVRPEVIQAGQ
jgi:hypothetical protein